MKITNEIRKTLSFKLLAMAVSKHGPALAKEAKRINEGLEKAHRNYLAAEIPGVPQERYAELIQKGVLTATFFGAENVYWPCAKDGKPSYVSRAPGYREVAEVEDGLDYSLKAALRDSAWSGVMGFVTLARGHYGKTLRVEFEPKLSQSLPDFRMRPYPHLHFLEPSCKEEVSAEVLNYLKEVKPLLQDADRLGTRVADILREGLKYREEVLNILNSCSTRKKLEDVFPEAAKLLPPEPAKRNEVVPAELAAKVRKQLMEGVPA